MPNHASPQDRKQYAADMAADLAAGETLEQIGDRYGCSRERIRQIINEHSGTTVPDILTARKDREHANAEDRRSRVEQAARDWSANNPTAPLEEGAVHVGATAAELRRILGARAAFHTVDNYWTGQRWSDRTLIELLQTFHAETGSLNSYAFAEWSIQRDGPTVQTPTNRFGGWKNALHAAGLTDERTKTRRDRVYTDTDLWAVVYEFFNAERVSYSYRAFQVWVRGVGGPSAALVRHRLQEKWSTMRDTVVEVIGHVAGQPSSLNNAWVKDVTRKRDWEQLRNQAADAPDESA